MGVDSKHPLYAENVIDWEEMRITYKGQRKVKEARSRFLPFTSGMIQDGALNGMSTKGGMAYEAYLKRAVFPELVKPAVETMIGVMHQKEATIELPAQMESMLEKATLRGESLQMLLRRINEEQMITGRLGLLLEVPNSDGPAMPYIALYCAEDAINWDESVEDGDKTQLDKLGMVVLDESGPVRKNQFEWTDEKRYRVLMLGSLASEAEGVYSAGVFTDDGAFDETEMIQPNISGQTLDQIPFVFINISDVVPEPGEAPLLGLSNLALTIYRGEADYRQSLYMQGQSTLVTIGAIADDGDDTRVGTGAVIELPMGGDAKYIGVAADGLSEQRVCLENDYERGEKRSDGLIDATSRAAESGESLRVRVAAKTASLTQIAITGAYGLQHILRIAAVWIGANPDEVKVTPNLDFVDDRLQATELTGYMAAKGLGAPLALETVHEMLQERGLTKLTWEEEKKRMTAEGEEGLPGASLPGDDEGATDAGAPEEDEGDGEDPKDPKDPKAAKKGPKANGSMRGAKDKGSGKKP